MSSKKAPPFRITSTCKGGGYRYCRTDPPHPKANAKGLYPLHRVLMENKLGRLLSYNEVVHHKDGDTANDAEENLELLSRSEHTKQHAVPAERIELTCPVCGDGFSLRRSVYRTRMKNSKSGKIFCSHICSGRGAVKITQANTPHGTHRRYRAFGCRCGECRSANAKRMRDYYQRNRDTSK